MLAAYAARISPDDPLAGLEIGPLPEPGLPAGWVLVEVRAATLNHHDLWSLRGVGLAADRLPMILGCDAAGVLLTPVIADPGGSWGALPVGTPVVVHSVIADPAAGGGDETLDPARSLLSERYPGTLAERVAVPARNVLRKPDALEFAEAACLPTAWLTAYRMLFTKGRVGPGDRVLVQGAGGGVATASVELAAAVGAEVYVTGRDPEKRQRGLALGATAVFEPGARLPERVDVVVETVGEATFQHSIRALKPGGRLVVSGATAGHLPSLDLRRLFFLQLEILGSTMGTRRELMSLLDLVTSHRLRPEISAVHPLSRSRVGFAALAAGEMFGKIAITPEAA